MKLSKRSSLLLGNVIEYYDIAIFAALSPYLETLISSDKNNASTTLWFIFAIRFLARPFGGYLLIKLAEYKGRKNALLVSSCLSGLATLMMFMLPTELNSEKVALYILTVQLLNSFSFGGEYPLVVSYLIRERKNEGEKSFLSGIIVCSSMIGSIISIIVVLTLSNMFDQYQMQNFGWRIPFFIGLTNIILAYLMRKNLPEDDVSSINLYKGRRITLKLTTFNIFIVAPAAIIFYAQNFCYLKLASKISEEINPLVLQLINISLLVSAILMVTTKVWKNNNVGENVYFIGNILLVLLSIPLFYFINSTDLTATLASWLGMTIISAMILSHLAKKLVKENPSSDKSMSLGYNLALSIFGGMTPLIVNQINEYNPIYIGIIFSFSTIPYLLLELFRLKGRK